MNWMNWKWVPQAANAPADHTYALTVSRPCCRFPSYTKCNETLCYLMIRLYAFTPHLALQLSASAIHLDPAGNVPLLSQLPTLSLGNAGSYFQHLPLGVASVRGYYVSSSNSAKTAERQDPIEATLLRSLLEP